MDSVEFSEKARRNFVGEAPAVDLHRNQSVDAGTWDRLTMQFK